MNFISERIKTVEDPLTETTSVVKTLERNGTAVIKLNMGDPARYFKIQDNILDAYSNALKDGRNYYIPGPGLSELRSSIAERYSKFYGTKFEEDKVIITQGVIEGLQFLNQALINKGNTALLLAPFFTQYIPCIKIHDGIPILALPGENTGWDVSIDNMEDSIKKLATKPKYLLITNPSNPTGKVLSEKSLKKIVDFAKDNDIFLVADEIYDEIVFNNTKFVSISKLANGTPHMIFNGASKNYLATGFRLGFAIIPEEDKKSALLRNAFIQLAFSRLSSNVPSQYAILEGIKNKTEHVKFMNNLIPQIQNRTNLTTKLINETGYLTATRPNGAFYVFSKIEQDSLNIRTDKEFVDKLLLEEGIQLTRGSSFGMDGYVRIVTLPDEKILTKAIGKIENFCKNHKK